jgi:hypothetical protein
MSLSLKVLLDHIADYLLFCPDTPLFWFILNISYDNFLHLSRQVGLSPCDCECLLATTNLAHHTKAGFTIKPKEWKMFIDGHYFFTVAERINECKVELDKKKMDVDAHINGLKH